MMIYVLRYSVILWLLAPCLAMAQGGTAFISDNPEIQNMKKVVFPRGGMPPIGPYSPAVIAGNMMFVSGQLGVDPKTGTIPGTTIDDETKQVMLNIEGILKEVGLTFDHVVKTTIFLKNMDDFGHVNKVYGSYFKEGSYPARETVEVSRLPKNANVEISVIVYIPTK